MITEQEVSTMNRRLSSFAFTILAVVALNSVALTLPAPVRAVGATQIPGVAYLDDSGACGDPEGQGATAALIMTGDLEGCHYIFVETSDCSPSGTYRELGTETFVGSYNGQAGTFRTTYRFTAKWEDCANLTGELFGRCQHPIIAGSGTGVFEGVRGRLDFKDDIEAGNFPYRGHVQWSSRFLSQRVLLADTRC
jgi:hypothetical protein